MPSRFVLTLPVLPLLLLGCDRQADPATQDEAELGTPKDSFVGEIDRSHAGEPLPAVSLTDPAGNVLDTGALAGGPVLVNLWATWCVPCREEMPALDELAKEYGDSLRVLTVSQDRKGAQVVTPYFAEAGFAQLEPWLDPNGKLDREISGKGMPITVLYDSAGREVWRIEGAYDWLDAEAAEALAEAIALGGGGKQLVRSSGTGLAGPRSLQLLMASAGWAGGIQQGEPQNDGRQDAAQQSEPEDKSSAQSPAQSPTPANPKTIGASSLQAQTQIKLQTTRVTIELRSGKQSTKQSKRGAGDNPPPRKDTKQTQPSGEKQGSKSTMDVRQITKDYSVSPQIAPQDMEQLASLGFRTIINNRPDGEVEGQPESAQLAKAAEQAGLAYHHLPLTPGQLTPELVEQVGKTRREAEGPVLAFCRTGTRSATLWALSEKGNRSADDIVAAAGEAGYDLSGLAPNLE